jgi:hypothetical protein
MMKKLFPLKNHQSNLKMVHYKLLYFPIRNLAEAIRLTFHYAGVEFEDMRIPLDKWPTEYKNSKSY